jgi:hypothetical protein
VFDRIRGQPYHFRDGDVVVWRQISDDESELFKSARQGESSVGKLRTNGEFWQRSRGGGDEPQLNFYIDYGDENLPPPSDE